METFEWEQWSSASKLKNVYIETGLPLYFLKVFLKKFPLSFSLAKLMSLKANNKTAKNVK